MLRAQKRQLYQDRQLGKVHSSIAGGKHAKSQKRQLHQDRQLGKVYSSIAGGKHAKSPEEAAASGHAAGQSTQQHSWRLACQESEEAAV